MKMLGTKVQTLRLALRMFIRQMPIDLADQNSAILMADPFGNRHEINSGHHAHRNKKMPAVMKAKLRRPGFGARQFQRLPKTLGRQIAFAPPR